MNSSEQRRLQILNEVEGGRLGVRDGAAMMTLSLRQARRVRAAYRREGAAGLAHGNRGRRPRNAVDLEVARRVVELASERYRGVNQQHLTELLEEEQEIRLSRSTVRRVLLGAGIRSPRTRRSPKHRIRRERKPQGGCCCRWTAARMTGLRAEGHVCVWWAPSTMPPATCPVRSSGARRTLRGTSRHCSTW